jgi:anti-sigma regulatory factor (Ser/Thr protein kinase)
LGWYAPISPKEFKSTKSVLQICDVEHFHWHLAESEVPVSLSTNGSCLSLAAAVELASLATFWKADRTRPAALVRVANCPIWSLLKEARWPDRKGRLKLQNAYATVLTLPSDPNDSWWTQRLRDLVDELSQSGFPSHLAKGLTGAVIEMADNVWQHSDSASPGLVAYQIRRRKFAFSVADDGVGVLASLRTNAQFHNLSSSMEAIREAIEPGISRNEDGGGMGFPSLLHALADLWGTARIRSGEAAVVIDRTQHERKKEFIYLPGMPGVHVSVRCALDPPGVR